MIALRDCRRDRSPPRNLGTAPIGPPWAGLDFGRAPRLPPAARRVGRIAPNRAAVSGFEPISTSKKKSLGSNPCLHKKKYYSITGVHSQYTAGRGLARLFDDSRFGVLLSASRFGAIRDWTNSGGPARPGPTDRLQPGPNAVRHPLAPAQAAGAAAGRRATPSPRPAGLGAPPTCWKPKAERT